MTINSAVTRRKLFTGGAAALAAVALPATHAWAEQAASSSTVRKIRFTPGSASGFSALLQQHFPSLVGDPHIAALLPVSFIIENLSTVPIKAHSVTIAAATSSDTYQTTVQHMFIPRYGHTGSPKFGVSGNRTRMTGQINLLGKSGIRLASPFFSWSPHYLQSRAVPAWGKLNRSARSDFFFNLIPKITHVDMSLEAVVFADGVVVGYDHSRLAMTYRVSRNAEHDEASSILKLIHQKASPVDIQKRLVLHATRATDSKGNVVSRTNPNAFLYHSVRQRHAKILLKRLENDGYQKFVRTVRYLSRQPKTVTTALTA